MTPERWRQIEGLYHSARERAPADRAALLAHAEPDLRREVETLLEQDASGGKILDRPAEDLLTDSTLTSVAVGSQLGPYRIEGLLGRGGMGEVYRAIDTRLDRKVAIKTSMEQFNARFEREARAISALNHPHICMLHDVGPNYLVMELVEGETLAAKLKKGKLSIDDTRLYGGQIAAALAEAHSKGITHRDLKPGNIMIAKNGVKVLDFGLAKSAGDQAMTASNAVMGTPAYMAPEQSEGKECDARTDIYALGLVLREMATGLRNSTTSSLAPHLAHVIDRCLTVEPESRWQSAKDLQLELAWTPQAPLQDKASATWPWMAVAALVTLIAAVGWWYATRPAPLRPLIRADAEIPSDTPPARGSDAGGMLALSPDGSRLALTLRSPDGKVRLYTRLLDQNQVAPLAGTENASDPFFSPDGDWIGFFADAKLKKISVRGGAAMTLCDALLPRGASWAEDGSIIAAIGNSGLSRVPSSGGAPVPLTKFKPGEYTHRWPQVIPGSQAVLFNAATDPANYDNATIEVVLLKTGERKTVQRGGIFPRYLPTYNRKGHLIYLQQNTLFAVLFDPGRLALAGAPVPVLEDVSKGNGIGGADFAFAGAYSESGTFVYFAQKATPAGWAISWLDSAGRAQPLYSPTGRYTTPRFSPDGKRLAFSRGNGQGSDLWVMDLDRDTPSRLTFLSGVNRFPVWTPDGKNIVFQSTNQAAPGVYWIGSDGSGEALRLTDFKSNEKPSSFSPDGKRLAFYQNSSKHTDIFTAALGGDFSRGALGVRLGKPELFVENGGQPAFSPNGRWLAFASNESGPLEVYVRAFPGPGGQRQISIDGGQFPHWSRDGRELVYETLDGRVMTVSYSANGPSFAVDKPHAWSEIRLQNAGIDSFYDLTPDGKRLAAMLAGDESTHLTLLLNFFDELRRRLPASGK